jgi:hypothetical protein
MFGKLELEQRLPKVLGGSRPLSATMVSFKLGCQYVELQDGVIHIVMRTPQFMNYTLFFRVSQRSQSLL